MGNEQAKANGPSYRTEAFVHWLNLGLMASLGVAGLVGDPTWWIGIIPLEMAVLWVVPDLPPFRRKVDETYSRQQLLKERAYYIDQLWGLLAASSPSAFARIKSLFLEPEIREDLDQRIIRRDNVECQRYLEMRTIISRLGEMTRMPNARISMIEVNRFEQVINGYLRLLIATRPLVMALNRGKEESLRKELKELEEKMAEADVVLRAALNERKRLLSEQLERIPRLRAQLELYRTRAEAIVYQIHQIHSQVLADPGKDVNAMLNEMIERHDMLGDPMAQLESDQMVQDFLNRMEGKLPSTSSLEPESEDPSRQALAQQQQQQQQQQQRRL